MILYFELNEVRPLFLASSSHGVDSFDASRQTSNSNLFDGCSILLFSYELVFDPPFFVYGVCLLTHCFVLVVILIKSIFSLELISLYDSMNSS